jgi:hypothetical protein
MVSRVENILSLLSPVLTPPRVLLTPARFTRRWSESKGSLLTMADDIWLSRG